MKKINSYVQIFLVSALLTGCVKEKITEVVDSSYYKPSYSLPVGSSYFTMEEFQTEYPYVLIPVPDTNGMGTSVDYFYFDSLFYENVEYFELTTDYPFQLSDYTENAESITSLTFRLNCINGLPGKVSAQVYFISGSGFIIDELFQDGWLTIDAAETDSEGMVTNSTDDFKNDVTLSEQLIASLSLVSYIRVVVRLETENFSTSKIRYYSNQQIWVQLGLRISLEIPLNETQN